MWIWGFIVVFLLSLEIWPILPPLFVCRICQHLVPVWFAWTVLLLPCSSVCFPANTKDQSVKASHVVFWFLQQRRCLIKAECCFPTPSSSGDPSLLRLSQHQLGSIRSPDNGRWHMPACITKRVAAALFDPCLRSKICLWRPRGGRSHRPLFFCGMGVCEAYARPSVWKKGKHFSRHSASAYLLSTQCSVSWLGGPWLCQLFNTHICILNNLITVKRT